jgi:CHAD domain-containing protein
MRSFQQDITVDVPPERVRKLTHHPLFAASGAGSRKKLRSVWFDTDRFDLYQSGISLCLVDAGRTRLQQVSLADGDDYVSGFVGDFDFLGITADKARAKLERAQRRGLGLAFEIQALERRWTLTLGDGQSVLARLVRGELRSGPRVQALCELWIEATEGTDGSHFCVARDLIAAFGLQVQPLPIEERGLRLARNLTLEPVRAAASPIVPQHDCVAALQAIVNACSEQFLRNEPGALASDDPEYVHQMRVAMRRLRSALRAFAPLIPAAAQQRFIPGLRALAVELGATRDWDVILEELILPVAQTRTDDPRLAILADETTALRDAARAHCKAALEKGEQHRLLAEIVAYVQCEWRPAEGPHLPELVQFAADCLDALHRTAAKTAKRARAQDIPSLHRLRIAIKRLRYTVEFFAPLFPRKAVRAYLDRMMALQEDLGLLNDVANAELRLADCATKNPALAEGVAFVHGWYATRLSELLQRIPGEIAILTKLRRFWKQR